jgi:mono/diheme cytochrome c family protein
MLAVLAYGFAACSSDADTTVTYYRDIAPLFEQRCARCHVAGGIAPFALKTYQDAAGQANLIKNAVANRIMPPWLAGRGCADYAADPSLSDDQIAKVVRWVESGAPPGDPATYRPLAPLPAGGLPRADVMLQPPMPYHPTAVADDYRCFLLDWPATTEKFMTGFAVTPGQPSMVHHVVVFLAPASDRARYQGYDDADPGPGYPCFGGPDADATSLTAGYNVRILGAWGPGISGGELPQGTGIRIEAGSQIVMQVHYNTLNGGGVDQTALSFELADSVEKEAFGIPFTDPDWVLDPSSMLIPAGQSDVVHEYTGDAGLLAALLTHNAVDNLQPFSMWAISYHMHLRGTHGRMDVVHADGSTECLVDIPHWNFHWQPAFGFAKPKVIVPGDLIHIECHWDNSADNQPIIGGDRPLAPRDLIFGENTTDEMCVGGFLITQ